MVTREFKGKSLINFPSDYTVIDIETTGLDPTYDSIIEVSALRIRGGEIIESFSSLVKPESYRMVFGGDYILVDGIKIRYIDSFIENLTGITNKMLHEALPAKEVLADFYQFIGGDILIGHNINFDINFLYDYTSKLINNIVNNDFVDTMRLSRWLHKELKHHRLSDISNFYKINCSNLHRALSDCNATSECFFHLRNTALEQFETIDNFLETTKKRIKQIKANDISSKTSDFDETHPLHGKTCVFTGVLEKMGRKEAMQIVVDLGGINADTVISKTNYLILGNNDYCSSVKDGKSNKQKKAEQLKLKGNDIEIISENVFYDLI